MPSPSSLSIANDYLLDATQPIEIKALLNGSKWGLGGVSTGATITYSFPTSNTEQFWSTDYTLDPEAEISFGFRGFDAAEQAAFALAIQSWANVANITITKLSAENISSVGDIRAAYTTTSQIADSIAYAYQPSQSPYGGDIWFNADPVAVATSYNIGTDGYQTMLHEIGHALGMDHPFEGTFTLPANLDNFKFTVMSYSVGPNEDNYGGSSYFPTTPMLLDIQAIQYIYGANMSYHTGNDTYTFDDSTSYYQTIWDAGGTDTIHYSGVSNATINLNAGTYSTLGNPITIELNFGDSRQQFDNVAIAYNVIIENATGSTGDDTLIGNNTSNILDGGFNSLSSNGRDTLNGNGGDDFLYGRGGNDTLDGGDGNDFLDGGTENDALLGGVGNDNLSGNDGNDSLTGNDGNDSLTGGDGNDILNGGAGNDFLSGNVGGDTLDGGDGDDTVYGGKGFDTLYGGSGNDTMDGALGDDTVNGNLGDDLIYGRDGFDTLYGGQNNDTIFAGEGNDYILGGFGIDNLNGENGDDTIFGGQDDDILNGGAGNDTVGGGLGADIMTGNTGTDTFFMSAELGKLDIITDFNAVEGDLIDLRSIDANINLANDQAFTFIGSGVFSNQAGQLHLVDSVLSGDVNGDSIADFTVQLTGVTSLIGTSFML